MFFKILQCSCFNIAGTVIATLLSGRALRLVAVAHAMIWGALRGVLNISWYQMLSAFVPGRSPQDVLVKVLLDQLVDLFCFAISALHEVVRVVQLLLPVSCSALCYLLRLP